MIENFDITDEEHPLYRPVRVVHVLRRGAPICPKCGQGLESEGGSVHPAGSWDEGPLYWWCEDCDKQWGHA